MKNFFIKWKVQISLSLLIISIFSGIIIPGKSLFWGTSSLQFFPWASFNFDNLLKGSIPLWNPWNGFGAPFLANYQSAVFYPLNWVVIPLYLWTSLKGLVFGYSLLFILHLIIAANGMSFVLKKLDRSEPAQFIGSMLWILGGYIVSRFSFISMVWSFAWIGWIVYGVLIIKEDQKSVFKQLIYLILPLSLQLLSGHAQTSAYTLLLAIILLVFPISEPWSIFRKKLFKFIGALFISVCLTALQLLPTLEYLLQSQRSESLGYDYAVNFSFWPQRIFSIFFGNFWGNPGITRFFGGGTFWEDQIYFGVIPILFITILLLQIIRKQEKSFTKKDRQLIYVMGSIAILSYVLALGKNFFLFPFLYKYIFIFRLFQAPSRFLLIFSFSIVILSAYGLDYWLQNKLNIKKIGLIVAISLAVILSSGIATMVKFTFPHEILRAILWSGIIILVFSILTILYVVLIPQKNNYIIFLLLVCILTDVGINNYPYGQFINNSFYDSSPVLVDDYPANGLIYLDISSEEFLKFNRYFRFDRIQLADDIQNLFPAYIPNTNLFSPRFKMVNNFDPFVPKQFDEFMSWLQKKDNDEQKLILNSFGVSARISIDPYSYRGYRVEHWQPGEIVQWYDCAVSLPADEILDSILYNESINSSKQCIFLEDKKIDPKSIEYEGSIQFTAEIQKIDQSKFIIKYEGEKPGWFLIRQSWFPGWFAFIDGEPVGQVDKADFLFQSVYVPGGRHTLIIEYKPTSYTVGLIISGGSWMLITLFIFISNFSRKRHLSQEL